MADVHSVLTGLEIPQYVDRFLAAGFDSWQVLCEITENDLEALNIELGHRRKLQTEIARTRSLALGPKYLESPYQSLSGISESTDVGPDVHSEPQGKRGYRHHPRPDENAPARPYSAYVMFSNHVREDTKGQSIPFSDLSKLVGERWQALPPAQKEEWKQKAALPLEKYKQDVAAYMKTENFRKYEQYVADFKAAQAAKKNEGKHWISSGGNTDALQQRSPESYSGKNSSALIPEPMTPAHKNARNLVPATTENLNPQKSEPKRPISRVQGQSAAKTTATARPRVAQACDSCRQRRVKCNGERPVCQSCQEYETECTYQDGKRDKEKKLTEQLWKKVKAYELLLLDLVPDLESAQRSAIQRALLLPPSSEDSGDAGLSRPRFGRYSSDSSAGKESTTSGVGSMGSTDHVNYDEFKRPVPDMKTPSYVGQASEVAWMQRLGRELKKEPEAEQRGTEYDVLSSIERPLTGHPDSDLWPDDMNSSVVGDQPDPYVLPIKSTADALVKTYFKTVHPAFPILNQAAFLHQYEQLSAFPETRPAKTGAFIALLQTIFAVSAVHAHVTDSDCVGDDRDHLLYFARARILGTHTAFLLSESVSMGQVQIFGLAAVYLISTNQFNRASSALSIAIRCAQGLGMHLKNVTPKMEETETLHGIYAWFALISLERILSIMVGRPCMVKEHDCSAPIPLPVGNEHQPMQGSDSRKSRTTSFTAFESLSASSSSPRPSERCLGDRAYETVDWSLSMTFFFHYVELSGILQRSVEGLYNPHVRHLKWSEIQRKIETYNRQLTQWDATLPAQFDLESRLEHPVSEQLRAALAVLSYSTRTIINRPALCRTERQIKHQSDESVRMNHDAAQRCVTSAQATLQFLPGGPQATDLNQSPIWFTLLHHVKRSATVLLLELSFRAEHMPSEAEEILADAIKAVNWIYSMGAVSLAARRAWTTLNRFLQLAARRVGGSTADLIISPSEPHRHQDAKHPTSNRFFDLDAWVMTAPYAADGHMDGNPLYGEMQMGGMDQFGFMRPRKDHPSFPSASEIGDLATREDQQDGDLEMWQPGGDPAAWFGFDGGAYPK